MGLEEESGADVTSDIRLLCVKHFNQIDTPQFLKIKISLIMETFSDGPVDHILGW